MATAADAAALPLARFTGHKTRVVRSALFLLVVLSASACKTTGPGGTAAPEPASASARPRTPSTTEGEKSSERPANLRIGNVTLKRQVPGHTTCDLLVMVINDGPGPADELQVKGMVKTLAYPTVTQGPSVLQGPTDIPAGREQLYFIHFSYAIDERMPLEYAVEVRQAGTIIAQSKNPIPVYCGD